MSIYSKAREHVLAIDQPKRPRFSSFWQMGSIDLFANLLDLSDPPIDGAIHRRKKG